MGINDDWRDHTQELAVLKQAVENTNEAFITIDENLKVILFNKAAENTFGYSRDEVIGHNLDVIMRPIFSRNHREALKRYAEDRLSRPIGHETEILAARKNGETFPASISLSVSELDGKLFFTGIITDMTEILALREKIKHSERLAALGQLAAEVTHEIKNPLMMIGGFARQLLQPLGDEERVKRAHIIADEVTRLEKLLADLREFHSPKPLAIEPVNIKVLLDKIYSLVKDSCVKKRIHTEIEIDENALLARGDTGRLEQVFLNLVKNSIEAMETGGSLAIQTKLSGAQAQIIVTDDGCGISEDHIEKIFDCFFSTKSRGTGLGLCIAKRFIEEHEGGSISVKSEDRMGTTFVVTLPLYRSEAGQPNRILDKGCSRNLAVRNDF